MYVLAMLARLVFVPHLNKYYAYNVMIICSQLDTFKIQADHDFWRPNLQLQGLTACMIV